MPSLSARSAKAPARLASQATLRSQNMAASDHARSGSGAARCRRKGWVTGDDWWREAGAEGETLKVHLVGGAGALKKESPVDRNHLGDILKC